jgi:hypothetical protein
VLPLTRCISRLLLAGGSRKEIFRTSRLASQRRILGMPNSPVHRWGKKGCWCVAKPKRALGLTRN